ncbi:MAG: hypothetical protein HOH38_04760 [Nitrospinaceae bacterium]|jgi:hypothetical protein|nr:hypothetical protein [Nitrospina sp.]MBT5868130.1 hypothetical protein [Nitrospinaceae bacterium]
MRKNIIKICLSVFLVLIYMYTLSWMSIGSNNFYMRVKQVLPYSLTHFPLLSIILFRACNPKYNGLACQVDSLREFIRNRFISNNINPTNIPFHNALFGRWYSNLRFDKKKVPCPKSANVILVAGQSNSANHVRSLEYKNTSHVNYLNGNCYVLDNPVLGASGDQASVVPAIASKLNANKPYIFLVTGFGASSITHWSSDGSGLSMYTNKHLLDLEKHGHVLSVVIWIQGEADNGRYIDYLSHFSNMKSNMLRGLSSKQNVKFVVTQTSRCHHERDKKLNEQQLQLGNDKNVYVTEVTDNLDNSFRFDGCHFNELGTEAVATAISSALNNILEE